MTYTTGWQEPAPGIVVITPGGAGFVRLLGLFFAVPGGYLLYQFLGGVVRGELTIAGWLMLPVFAAVFLVPGWIILFGKKRTRLDVTRREATEEFDFLVYTRRSVTRIPPQARVMVRYEKSGSTYPAHVYLDAQPKLILLSMFGSSDKPAAMQFAQKAAGLFGLGVDDRCVEGGEVTSGGVVVDRLEPDEAD